MAIPVEIIDASGKLLPKKIRGAEKADAGSKIRPISNGVLLNAT
jgi:hypothetical protein